MINVSEVVLDDDFVQPFTVFRSSGQQGPDGWINTEAQLTLHGVVSVARARDLQMVPEGDRVGGAMVFHSTLPIYTTRVNPDQGISDVILWRGERYKVSTLLPYVDYGYYSAVAVRLLGA